MISFNPLKKGYLGLFQEIVLRSASPRRRALLHFLAPSLMAADIDEATVRRKVLAASKESAPNAPFIQHARAIARAVAAEKAGLLTETVPAGQLYIAADTIVVAGEEMRNKPQDLAEAEAMLRASFGETLTVITAVCLRTQTGSVQYEELTDVIFAPYTPLMEKELNNYLTPALLDRAGGFGIQDMPPVFLAGVNGDYNNVIGFPVASLLPYLTGFQPRLATPPDVFDSAAGES